MYSTAPHDQARELAAALLSELARLREASPDDADLLAALEAIQVGRARLEACAARVSTNGPGRPDPIADGAVTPQGPSPDHPRATGIIEPPTPDATGGVASQQSSADPPRATGIIEPPTPDATKPDGR